MEFKQKYTTKITIKKIKTNDKIENILFTSIDCLLGHSSKN